jgi:hypothetical protein
MMSWVRMGRDDKVKHLLGRIKVSYEILYICFTALYQAWTFKSGGIIRLNLWSDSR